MESVAFVQPFELVPDHLAFVANAGDNMFFQGKVVGFALLHEHVIDALDALRAHILACEASSRICLALWSREASSLVSPVLGLSAPLVQAQLANEPDGAVGPAGGSGIGSSDHSQDGPAR